MSGTTAVVGNDVTLSNGVQLGGHVQVGDGVIMGGLAAAQQFGRIGRYAFISGLSGVNDGCHSLRHGDRPALPLWADSIQIGLRRRKIPRENIHALRALFRVRLPRYGTHRSTKTPSARQTATGCRFPEVAEVVGFILADAKRPIFPARKKGGDMEAE